MIREQQLATLAEKELYEKWLLAIHRYGLFSPEANKLRERLGQLISERIDYSE